MKKQIGAILGASILLFCTLFTPQQAYCAAESDNNELTAASAVLMDAKTGEILYEKNPHEKREPASVTKIMTMLLVMEAIDRGEITLQDKVTITEEAAKTGGTQLYLETGEVRSIEDLLYGVSVESANDAANALAAHLGGTVSEFIAMMNRRASELGLEDTNFNSACGLHEENHYTSAYDIAIMSKELLKHQQILTFTNTWMKDVYVGRNSTVKRTLANTNKLISRYSYIDGLKTGYTSQAGHCIAATGSENGLRLICVLLGSKDSETRFKEAITLMQQGFSQYKANYPAKAGEVIGKTHVFNAKNQTINITVPKDVYKLTKKNENADYSIEIEIDERNLAAPMQKGKVIGKIIVKNGNEIIDTLDAISAEDAAKCSFLEYFTRVLPEFY